MGVGGGGPGTCNAHPYIYNTVDGGNPAPPRMMIIAFFIGF